jgi:tetratricopeptide (TPR) repeat protein
VAGSEALAPFQVDIANVLIQQNKLSDAEKYFMQALPAISQTFGAEHLYTANVLSDIAKLYVLQGKYSQAELLITKAIAVQEKIYGSNHYFVAPSWLTMASICQAKGDFARAEDLIKKAVLAVEKTGNVTRLVAVQQQAAEMRSVRVVAYGPIAKAVN